MKKTFETHSPTQTIEFATKIGSLIKEPCVLAFSGGMGSGKTCFTTGLVKGVDYFGEVNSPTFAIVNEYLGGRLPIFHFDMYRIADEDELYAIGFYDYLDMNGILVIEWSENIADFLPEDTVYIHFSNQIQNNRTITIECSCEKNFLKEL